jgi:hypothetical protein
MFTEYFSRVVNIALLVEYFFDLSEILGMFSTRELDIIELGFLTSCLGRCSTGFKADFSDEVGQYFIEDSLCGIEGWVGVAVREEEVLYWYNVSLLG